MKKISVISAIDTTTKVLLWAQIERMRQEGYEVGVICSKGANYNWITEQGVDLFAVDIKRYISPFSDLVAIWKMYRFFKKKKVDIVHTHTPKPSLIGQLAAKMAGVPIIINTVHGFYFHDHMKPLIRRFYIAMEWISARCSTMILSQNPEDVETAVKLGICKRNKIRLLGNGVDLTKFNPDRFDDNFKKQKRREIGVPENTIVIGIIGRLVKEKGYLELFKAFKNIIKEKENVWLIIIGPEEPEKADRIFGNTFREYGIESRTKYLGARDDIPELLACCDIYTLPSWREGFPRSAIEAAAMKLPIVTTDIRGCRQVVEDEVNGLLVPLKDSKALEKALLRLIKDNELRFQFGKAGFVKAQKEFDEQRVCRIVLDTYKEELNKSSD